VAVRHKAREKLLVDYLSNLGYKVATSKVKTIASDVLFSLSEKLFGDPYDYHPGIPPTIMNDVLATDFARHYLEVYEQTKDFNFLITDRHKLCYYAYPIAYESEMK
jgi:hypothetical protein